MSVVLRNGELDGSRRRNTYRETWNSGSLTCISSAIFMIFTGLIVWAYQDSHVDESGIRILAPTILIAAVIVLIVGIVLHVRRRIVIVTADGIVARTNPFRAQRIPWRNIADVDVLGGSKWQSAIVADGEEVSPFNPRYERSGTLVIWTVDDAEGAAKNGLMVPTMHLRMRMQRGLDACERIEDAGREHGVSCGSIRAREATRRMELLEAFEHQPGAQSPNWWRGSTRSPRVSDALSRAALIAAALSILGVGWFIEEYVQSCGGCERFEQAAFKVGYAVSTGWVPGVIEDDYPKQRGMRVVCPRWVPLGKKRSFTCSVSNGDFDQARVTFTSRAYDEITYTTAVTKNYSPRIEQSTTASYRHRFPDIKISCPSGISTTGITKKYLDVTCSVRNAPFTSLVVTIAVKEGFWWWKAPYSAFSSVTEWVETSVADDYIEDHPKIVLDCPNGLPERPRKPFHCSVEGAPFTSVLVDLGDPAKDDIYFEEDPRS